MLLKHLKSKIPGRATRYLIAPPQTRTSGFPAYGSSYKSVSLKENQLSPYGQEIHASLTALLSAILLLTFFPMPPVHLMFQNYSPDLRHPLGVFISP